MAAEDYNWDDSAAVAAEGYNNADCNPKDTSYYSNSDNNYSQDPTRSGGRSSPNCCRKRSRSKEYKYPIE